MELTEVCALITAFLFLGAIGCILRANNKQNARQRAAGESTEPSNENIENAGSTEASAPVREDIGRISETVNNSFQIEENGQNANDLPPAYEDLFIEE